MIINRIYSVISVLLCALVAVGNAWIVLVRPNTALNTPQDTTTFETLVMARTAGDDNLTLSLLLYSSPTSISITSTGTAVVTTSTLVEPSAGVPCVNARLEGLVMHPCLPKVTTLAPSYHINASVVKTYWPANISTTTETETRSFTTTVTVTKTLSEVSKQPPTTTATENPAMTTASGLCFWAEQAILTPCPSLVVASGVPAGNSTATSAAVPLAKNPFNSASKYVRYLRKKLAFLRMLGVHD